VGDELQFEQIIFKQNPETEIRIYDELTAELFAESVSYRKFQDFFDRLIQEHQQKFSKVAQMSANRLAMLGRKIATELTQNPRHLDEVYYAITLWALDLHDQKGTAGLRQFDGVFHFRSIAEALQERYDGRGIRGLKGEQIPLAARVITAIQPIQPFMDQKMSSSSSLELQSKYRAFSGKQLDPRLAAGVSDILRSVSGESTSRGRVVIVDSDAEYAQELSSRLRQMSHETTIYPDGLSALSGIKRDRPDLIISEVMLSQLDGFSLVARLRSDDSLREIPIIFLSDSTAPEHSTKALQLGADDFLSKSQQNDFIMTKLEKLLKRSRS